MNCEKCKELLVDYLEGVLERSDKQAIESHLNTCPPCRAEANEIISLRDRLVTNGKALAQTNLEDKVVNRIVREQSSKLREVGKSNEQIRLWRKIMKSRITKFAAAAVIIIAGIVSINEFFNSGVAWAQVLEAIRNAQTLTWKTTFETEAQAPQVFRTMVREPYYMRCEFSDGRVWILDQSEGKTVILDPSRKLAVVSSTAQSALNIYNAFRNFQTIEGFSVEQIGKQQVGGKVATGFQLIEADAKRKITVWADPQSQLPVQIEERGQDLYGNTFQAITTDIVFDIELDESLFSLEPPAGYRVQEIPGPVERRLELEKRTRSATNMDQVLKACLKYAAEHEGQWPESLAELASYGIGRETLINPSQPQRENGYIYLKPDGRLWPSIVVLYEAYDVWGQGINAGFADGHIEFIKEESEFCKRLVK